MATVAQWHAIKSSSSAPALPGLAAAARLRCGRSRSTADRRGPPRSDPPGGPDTTASGCTRSAGCPIYLACRVPDPRRRGRWVDGGTTSSATCRELRPSLRARAAVRDPRTRGVGCRRTAAAILTTSPAPARNPPGGAGDRRLHRALHPPGLVRPPMTFGPQMVHSSDYRSPAPYARRPLGAQSSAPEAQPTAGCRPVRSASSGETLRSRSPCKTPPSIGSAATVRGRSRATAHSASPSAVHRRRRATRSAPALRRLTIPDSDLAGTACPEGAVRAVPPDGHRPGTGSRLRRRYETDDQVRQASRLSTAMTSSTATAHDPDRTRS